MGRDICQKIKAAMLIAMLAVAEARNAKVRSNAFPNWRSGETARKAVSSETFFAKQVEAMKADPDLKGQADTLARQVEAMMAESKFQEHANLITKQIDAMVTDPNFQKQTKLIAKQMEVMTASPHLQEQAKLLAQQAGGMKGGPKLHEQADAFIKHVKAMEANPNLKRQGQQLDKELEAMMANPNFQKMKAMAADPNSQAFAEHMKILTSDSSFQSQVERVAKHAETMMAEPSIRDKAKHFVEQMATMKSEPNAQEQAKKLAEQMEALKGDAELQAQATLIAEELTGLATDPTIQKHMNEITERVKIAMADPNLQDQAQLIAKHVQTMAKHPKLRDQVKLFSEQLGVSQNHPVKHSGDNTLDNLVNNLSGDLFDRALKLSRPTLGQPLSKFAAGFTRMPSWNSFRKTSVSIQAQKDEAAAMISRKQATVTVQKEQVKVLDQRKPVTVMAQKEREGNDVQDALAGLTVAFSLLSKAIACSSIVGVSPLVGLWSAVVMGVSAPLLGSRPGVISGTAAVVTVPLSQLVAARGTEYIAPAILLAAVLEITFGALKLSKYTVLVTDSVLAGFLNALGIILFESQGKIFTKAPDQAAAVGIAALCVAIVQGLPQITKAVPSSLVGLIVSTGVGIALNLKLEKLVDKAGPATFAGGLNSLPTPIDFGKVAGQLTNPDTLAFVVPAAFTIAFISILETLLAGRVVDELKDEPICTFTPDGRIECFSDTDEEEPDLDVPTRSVLALGTGQFISACLGGFGGCGLIPQTVLNIKSGGGGAISSTAYAASMATFVLLLAPAVGQITSPALAGIFLTVAYDTVQWEATANAVKAALPGNSANPVESRIELVALLTAGVVCYKVDAALGIVAGVVVEQTLRKVIPGVGDEE